MRIKTINPKIKPKYYWLIKPECYPFINKILNSKFTNCDIDSFIKFHTKGIYITYDKQMTSDYHKWGHMPYPDYYKNDNIKKSKFWLRRWGFKFQGEISRKSKLQKIKQINDCKM